MPKLPKQKEQILVGAFNTPFKAAIARNQALKDLGYWDAFYKPKKKTSPKKALPRDCGMIITLGKLKKDEQRKNSKNNQKNATKRIGKHKSTT